MFDAYYILVRYIIIDAIAFDVIDVDALMPPIVDAPL